MVSDNFLRNLNISSVTEIYCDLASSENDFSYLNSIISYKNWQNISYIGLNFDKKVIENNRHFFRLDKTKFFSQLDAVKDPIPRADLIILNDVFSNLSKKNIWLLLSNIKESGTKYLMIEKPSESKEKTVLNLKPFYLPSSEMVVSIDDLKKKYEIYDLSKVAFLLEYLPDVESLLRSKLHPFLLSDFYNLELILGSKLYRELIISFKNGYEKNLEFIQSKEVNHLLNNNNGLGHEICGFYFRILNQSEIDLVQLRAKFVNKKNFYKTYLIVNNYLNFLILDPIYKII